MANLKEILIPKVNAQSDAFSQPTFGAIDGSSGGTSSASILLSSDKTSVQVGEKFKVRVQLKTNDIDILEYRLVIDFDPSKLSVVDADSTTAGTQVKFLDTVFTIEDAEDDNSVASVGRIRLNAAVPDEDPLSVSKDVVEIEFQAQALGSTSIQVVDGVTGSQIVRQAGVGLSFTSNEVNITIATETAENPTDNTDDDTDGGTVTPTPTTPSQIPSTAIGDSVSVLITLGIGVILLLLGLSLKRPKKSKSESNV